MAMMGDAAANFTEKDQDRSPGKAGGDDALCA